MPEKEVKNSSLTKKKFKHFYNKNKFIRFGKHFSFVALSL
jgi:hypothetical protein